MSLNKGGATLGSLQILETFCLLLKEEGGVVLFFPIVEREIEEQSVWRRGKAAPFTFEDQFYNYKEYENSSEDAHIAHTTEHTFTPKYF